MTDRFQILTGPRCEKQWTIIRVTQAFRKTFLMRSNTTFHPEILFDWPPQMFHVLLEEHRKICVKAMSCMSDVIIPLDMLSRSEWLWLLLWCLQVPGQLAQAQLPILVTSLSLSPGSGSGPGRAVPTPPKHWTGRHIASRAETCTVSIVIRQSVGINHTRYCSPFSPPMPPLPPIILSWPLFTPGVLFLRGRARPGAH